ncbi:cysteine proteinase inhibitor 5-like [Magnolia sinica]|uniref:cysteine proteinase inhibitor 5-like n=1 Tax=Magnolia sinica TaxID=86752 RepID=UPI002659088C|nr:cysteine proteinase inhibitor 5-like [Magnolia sinica]
MQIQWCLLLLVLVLHQASATRESPPLMVGGWRSIKDASDPHILEIGEFAVSEYNKEKNAGLMFRRVIDGQTQVVAGINYRLTVEAMHDGVGNRYEAEVWEKAWEGFRSLTSFKPAGRS